jgi:hypothetical protein
MATEPTKASTKASKPHAKATRARKPAAAKASATRTKSRSAQTRTARAKASRARTIHQTESAARQAQAATRDTAQVVGDYAERAVLIPVGAALIARERVVAGVSDTISTYSSTTKTQQQLRRFERRGATARKRLEREVRKARVRVERELRQRRRAIGNQVNHIEKRRDAFAKNGSELADRIPEFAERAQERLLSLV